jgi:SprT-like family
MTLVDRTIEIENPPAAVTKVEYSKFSEAFEAFNVMLFEGLLPPPLITLQRKSHSKGFFGANRFAARQSTALVSEIGLNPDAFIDRTDEQILSTLVHEMVHCEQHLQGAPARGYHNRKWAARMKELGLYPSNTGAVGGRETGQVMSHYIIPDGAYSKAYAILASTGFALNWQSCIRANATKAPTNSKTKFSCDGCGQNVWGKPDTYVMCARCFEDDNEVHILQPEEPAP